MNEIYKYSALELLQEQILKSFWFLGDNDDRIGV